MFQKISYYGMADNLLNLIKDIYGKTESAMKVGDESTEVFRCAKGVRQWCFLCQTIFNMYIDDIHRAYFDKFFLICIHMI